MLPGDLNVTKDDVVDENIGDAGDAVSSDEEASAKFCRLEKISAASCVGRSEAVFAISFMRLSSKVMMASRFSGLEISMNSS